MSSILSILIILVCIMLIVIVLVQNSKGGGLASNFSSNNQVMGVRRTTDVLDKATWGFAIALLVLSLLSAPKTQVGEASDGNRSTTKEKVEGMNVPVATPKPSAGSAATPTPAPTPTEKK